MLCNPGSTLETFSYIVSRGTMFKGAKSLTITGSLTIPGFCSNCTVPNICNCLLEEASSFISYFRTFLPLLGSNRAIGCLQLNHKCQWGLGGCSARSHCCISRLRKGTECHGDGQWCEAHNLWLLGSASPGVSRPSGEIGGREIQWHHIDGTGIGAVIIDDNNCVRDIGNQRSSIWNWHRPRKEGKRCGSKRSYRHRSRRPWPSSK